MKPTEALMAAAITPLWLASASGFVFWTAAHVLTRPWRFLP